ncbi:hypothetical protein EZS27_007818 [termite gut metagenome]|uniref:Uncharacterized protein n=1 Tax=termite gut metagenome TaxID=433724 RepID=A0A5J4SF63_9ZZZZ
MNNKQLQDNSIVVDAPVLCRGCAELLAQKCYQKHWYFHLVRDPLVWGMQFLAWCNGIDAKKQVVRKTYCKGCIRFMKTGLEEKSATFKFLNRFIGPWFGDFRNGMLTEEDKKEARQRAMDANS